MKTRKMKEELLGQMADKTNRARDADHNERETDQERIRNAVNKEIEEDTTARNKLKFAQQ